MTLTVRHLSLLAGSLFAATAAIDVPHTQAQPFVSTSDYVLEALFALSLGFGAAALWASARAAGSRRLAAAWAVPALGYTVLAVTAGATHVAGHDVGGPAFPIGLLLVIGGSVALFVVDLRKRLRPRGAGVVLVATVVAMVALGEGWGVVAWSVGWFALATLLTPSPARPSAAVERAAA